MTIIRTWKSSNGTAIHAVPISFAQAYREICRDGDYGFDLECLHSMRRCITAFLTGEPIETEHASYILAERGE